MNDATSERARDRLPLTVVALMKGIVERDVSPETWQDLLHCKSQVRDYVGVIGLELRLDEAEGFAYLRQRVEADGETALPRLVPRRQLSFSVSLLLALLRRRLVEADASGGDTQLVLTREDIHDLNRHILRDVSNEAKQADKLDRDIDKIVDLGFLRPLKRGGDIFEVRRILAAFIDAEWLSGLDRRIADYVAHAAAKHETAEDA